MTTFVSVAYGEEIDESHRDKANWFLIDNILVGGTKGDKWYDADQVEICIDGGETYRLFSNGQEKLKLGSPLMWMEPCFTQCIEFYDTDSHSLRNTIQEKGIALTGLWNPLLHGSLEEKSKEQEQYQAIIKDYLADKGLDIQVPQLLQVISVDLEGDGVNEVILTASNLALDQYPYIAYKDDYTLILLRKLVDGEVQTVPLYDFTWHKDPDFDSEDYPGYHYRGTAMVKDIMDLNGDGIYEIILKELGHEAFGYSVWSVTVDEDQEKIDIKEVLYNGWGV